MWQSLVSVTVFAFVLLIVAVAMKSTEKSEPAKDSTVAYAITVLAIAYIVTIWVFIGGETR